MYTVRDSNIEHQQVFRTADRPLEQVKKLWEHDYRIREITYASNQWITVGERLKVGELNQDVTFEAKWDAALGIIARCVDEGRRIQYLHFAAGQWVIMMDKKLPEGAKPKQTFHMFETGFPHEFLNEEVWGRNRMVTQCTYGDKMWIVIAEDIPHRVEVIQGLILKNLPVSAANEFPKQVMLDCIKDKRFIKCIAYDDADRSYGIIYERNKLLPAQGMVVSTLFPQKELSDMGCL